MIQTKRIEIKKCFVALLQYNPMLFSLSTCLDFDLWSVDRVWEMSYIYARKMLNGKKSLLVLFDELEMKIVR